MKVLNPFRFDKEVTHNYFCGRSDEIKELKSYIDNSTNVIISMKRRIGKTSLIKEVIQNHLDESMMASYVDLLSITSVKELYEAFVVLVQSVVGHKNVWSQVATTVSDSFKQADISMSIGSRPSLKITFKGHDYYKLLEILLDDFHHFIVKNKIKVVFAIDEFQKISLLENNEKIEAILRSAIQSSHNISYIFTGSNETLLNAMFSKTRPFYRQGVNYQLRPIEDDVLFKWANERFKRVDTYMKRDAFDTIYTLVNKEIKIMQHLFFNLFRDYHDSAPIDSNFTKKTLIDIYSNHSEISMIFNSYTLNEQKMLKVIVQEDGVNVTISSFINEYNIAQGSVSKVLKQLEQKNIIQRGQEKIELIDTELKLWILAHLQML